MNSVSRSIQITSTFVAEPVEAPLRFLLEKVGIESAINFSEFNQVFQEALDPNSLSSNNEAGINLFFIRLEDFSEGEISSTIADDLEKAFSDLSKRKVKQNILVFCPSINRSDEIDALEKATIGKLSSYASVSCVSSHELRTEYFVESPFDTEAEASGRIPFTHEMYAALAAVSVRNISLQYRSPAKVIVLDADNTLWGGIAGEDGPNGLDLDGPWRDLQQFMVSKQSEGFLLALCSKNNESDLDQVFNKRADDLVLHRKHFAGWKANWLPKSRNIQQLANELNLGLDSFIFIDDNPAEIAEVAASCPEVISICLPDQKESFPHFLRHLWCFDRPSTTSEDSSRTEFYQKESQRRELQDSSQSFEAFLKSLDLNVEITKASTDEVARISQLTLRTNQFNANPLRLSENELASQLDSGKSCLSVRVSDRFGDYGLVGALLFTETESAIRSDLFLLSCRALGKGVERRMLIALGQYAQQSDFDSVEISFNATDRNEPVRRFLAEIEATFDSQNNVYRISAKAAANLSPLPSGNLTAPKKATEATAKASQTNWSGSLFFQLADEWSIPGKLQAELSNKTKPRPEISQAFVKPGSPVQKKIAAIWEQTLGIEKVGVEDTFSELGGNSVQLVRVFTALKREFNLNLTLPELFTLPTIIAIEERIRSEKSGTEVKQTSTSVTEKDPSDHDVAIIGLALRVPGANDPDQFWDNLVSEKESLSRFERDELEFPEEFDRPDFVPVKGIIEDIDKFDAAFFGLLPKDAKIMDPQQRIFLELAWEAMERSGYQPDNHSERIGVYAGAYFDSYLLTNLCTDPEFLSDLIPQIQVGSLQTEIGNDKDYLATRVAFKLNLRGPAMTMQTACSTSAVAIAEACRSIRDGICDMALAGGVTVTLPYKRGYFYTEQGMLSGDGHCRAFDENASGTVFGNGAGVVMLKRLSDAVRDRDHIHAVIRGTGINNDGGVKHSYTAPSVDGQVGVIRMAHEDAGIDPSTISAIEAHGTGTPLGDPIEVTALTKAFRAAGVTENQFCSIGSLKTNIGHLDVASGVCGVIKTALSLENEALPALLHFQKSNPKIDFENSPFFPNAEFRPWKTEPNGTPRRAGVSSFGVGGTNVHVVLEEAPAVQSVPSPRDAQLFLLSARTESALEKASENLSAFTQTHSDETDPADAAWTLAIGRKPFRNRRAIVATDFDDLREKLSRQSAATITDRSNPPVNFMFPGQGSQHINMARDFYNSEPRFKELVDRCSNILRPHLDVELTGILFPVDETDVEKNTELLKNTTLAQPAIFVIEYALADLWKHWGVTPTAMIGHSVGEFVAACHAGVFTLEEGLKLLADRGRLMGELPGGGMLSVRLPEEDVLSRLPENLDLAAINSPGLCVVAGPHDALQKFCDELTAEEIVAKPLHTSHAFHSWMMDPVVDKFAACFDSIDLQAPDIPILSTVTGEWLTEEEATNPLYWAKHLRETVRFSQVVTQLSEAEEAQIFIEVGPGQTLGGLALQSIERSAGHTIVSTCLHVKEEGSDQAKMLQSLGKLWTKGVEIDWRKFYGDETRKRIPLPTYPFERKRHWVDPKPISSTQQNSLTGPAPLPQNGAVPQSAAPSLEPEFPVNLQTFPNTNETQMEPATKTTAPRSKAIAAEIREILTNLSGIPEDELTGDATYLELGFDSLLLTQVSKAFQDGFGTSVKMRQLMTDFSTIDSMVDHLDATLAPDLFRETEPAAEPVLPDTVVANAPIPPQAPIQPAAVPATAAPLPTPYAPVSYQTPASSDNGTVQSVIAQQMALMQQQIALLQGGVAAQPVAVPVPQVAEAPQPQSAAPQKPTATLPTPPAEELASAVSAPTTKIDRDIDDSLTEQQSRHLDELIEKYTAKTKSSKALTAEYRQWYADPRTVSNFNRLWKEMIYQIVVKKSKGSRLLDIDGNEYIDILNGFGPGFLGHSPDRITAVLHEQLDRGVEVGPQSQTAMEASKLFCELTGNERASFVNTGSEAVQAAMRLSRTVTGRDKIVVFEKDYHGNFDEMLVRGVGSGDNIRTMPSAPGIPNRAVDDVIVLPYGTDESLEIIRNRAHELAAVIVEPIQSRRPEFQPKEFIQELRKITEESGTTFVFDEVITGFRTGPRGAQEYFGVEADIATYGKVVGAGMPIGVVAGKAKFMDTFDGGHWEYGDESFPEKNVTFFAGTFVRHPLAMAAAKEMLLHLRESGPQLWVDLKAKADRLAGTVNQMFIDNDVPFRMPNFGSQMFVRHIDDNKYANLLFFHMREKGVFLLEGFPTYMTTAHTDEDIDYVISAFRESIAEMQDAGFFQRPATATIGKLNGSRLSGPPRLLSTAGVEQSSTEVALSTTEGPRVKKPRAGTDIQTFPLTEPLAEIWLASQVNDETSLCFNEVVELDFEGNLDVDALHGALQEIVDRHEAFRATFLQNGDGFQIRPAMTIDLPVVDLSKLGSEEQEAKHTAELDHERATIFDLENGPLFHAKLLRLSSNKHALIMNAHHLVCDGWSYNVLTAELSELYRARLKGEPANLPSAPQFGKFAVETIAEEKATEGGESENYWLSQFNETVPPLSLPAIKTGGNEYRSERIFEQADGDTLRGLKKVAAKSGATLFAAMLSAYQILLSRIGRQSRVITGFPAAGQNSTEGYRKLIGHCVNFLPFVGTINKDEKFTDLLRATQDNLLDGFDHQDYTFGRLIKKLPISQRPKVDAVFNLERMDQFPKFPGLDTQIQDISRNFNMNPMFLCALETNDSIELLFTVQTNLISTGTASQWMKSYVAILQEIVATPDATVGEISTAMAPEHFELLHQWNTTQTDYPRDKTIPRLFDEVAAEKADASALAFLEGTLSYSELATKVDRIAQSLVAAGATQGDRIGLFLERSPEQIAAILAILKLGAAYVPLDPEYPQDRINFMLEDCRTTLVVSQASLLEKLPKSIGTIIDVVDAINKGDAKSAPPSFEGNSGSTPGCVIYTSGSTGQPKGVVINHRGIVRLIRNTNFCDFGPDETILHAASICFDASLFEIFGSLLNGGTLALPPAGQFSISTISECIKEHKVSTLWLTSGLFQLMVEEDLGAFSNVKQLITGGDVVPVFHARQVLEAHPDLKLINGYGPTENVTFTTTHPVSVEDLDRPALPVGRPISNTSVWIIDENGVPAAPGIAGELCTGGDGLALEYLNNPDLTAEKFITIQTGIGQTERVYRTGDLCRFQADGAIEFMGRIDHQVKIRGYRVEPGEVEAVLAQYPHVGQAKVVVRGSTSSDKSLVAFVAQRNGVRPTPNELKDYLRSSLPDYMVPSSCVVLDSMPVTPNGKIDTKALPETNEIAEKATPDSPATESELQLKAIWESVLQFQNIELDDDFFSLGGHSLLGMKLFARIQRDMEVSLPLSVLFNAPTVRQLAREIDSRITVDEPVASESPAGYLDLSDTGEIGEAIAETTVRLKSEGDLPPLFGVHGGDGGIFFYRDLASGMNDDRPFYAFEAAVLTNGGPIKKEPIESTAARYVAELVKVQPDGPVHLCGYSFGGVVAYEMACQLSDAGREIKFLGLIDTENPSAEARKLSLSERVAANWSDPAKEKAGVFKKAAKLGKRVSVGLGYRLKFGTEGAVARALPTSKHMGWVRQTQVRQAYEEAMLSYKPGTFSGDLTLFRASECQDKYDLGEDYRWSNVVEGNIKVIDVPGNHISIFHKENIGGITQAMVSALETQGAAQ